MTSVEYRPEPNESDHMRAVIELIRITSALERAQGFCRYPVTDASFLAMLPKQLHEATQNTLIESRDQINAALLSINGISHTYSDPESGEDKEVTIIGWLGVHPTEPRQQRWRTIELPVGTILSIDDASFVASAMHLG